MMPAAKHGDPQMGIDIHLCLTPVPTPLPTPHMSIVFDPMDYIPILGATVTVCGMKRATAGTEGIAIHIPPGFPFAPKPPSSEDELFMGSATVIADGDPMSHISHPVLCCQVAGMISPPRLKKTGKRMMLLPTTFNLAIPSTVFLGGPPTISLMGMASKLGFAALGKLAKSKLAKKLMKKFKDWRKAKFGHLPSGFLKCIILRAEPVNILTGAVSIQQEDFILTGQIPIEWQRSYASDSARLGVCGYGWETPADIRLELDIQENAALFQITQDDFAIFPALPKAIGNEYAVLELMDGALLSDHGDHYRVITKNDHIYLFAKNQAFPNVDGMQEYPINRIQDLSGNYINFERRAGQLVSINESSGRRIKVISKDGLINSLILHLPDVKIERELVRYQYDNARNLIAVLDTLGNPYRFEYDQHHMTRHIDRNGLAFSYEYDKHPEDWRVVHAFGDGGLYNYRFEYFEEINERRITDSLGNVSLVKLNEIGLPISEIDPLQGITQYEYDEMGRTTAVTDAGNRRTGYVYDERGNLLKLIAPDGNSISTEFDHNNKAIAITDLNGGCWQQTWNEQGLLIAQTTPLGNMTQYEYNRQGQLVAAINPLEAKTELGFDVYGNLICLKDALGHETRFTYDPLGNVTQILDPLSKLTQYRYDAKSRLTDLRLPSGALIHCDYDAEDNLIRYVDENGAETRLGYFGQGEIAQRIQPDGHTLHYHYDTEEQLIGVSNQRGETYHIKRDALGRVVEEIDYWEQSRRYSYNASDHLQSATDPLERSIHYVTDPLGRILQKKLPDGSLESFVYDANGYLIETKNAHAAIQRQFDAEGNLLEETQIGYRNHGVTVSEFKITHSYDANGNRITRVTNLGNKVDYQYDALEQLVSVSINQQQPIQISRDAEGRITKEALSPELLRHRSYSPDGYLTEQAITNKQAPLFATRYDYDSAGNLTQRSDSHYGSDRYRYDPMGRILEHLNPQQQLSCYVNDPAGDRLLTRTVDQPHLQFNGLSLEEVDWCREGEYQGNYYRFDRAGNLLQRREPERELHLTWDANQRLIESTSNNVVTRYGYDPLGRRIFKETGDSHTQFYWDGDALLGDAQLMLETTDTPPVEPVLPEQHREFVYYADSFEPLALVSTELQTKTIYFYHNDPNGCPSRLTDTQGDIKWAVSYSAWGQITQIHAQQIDNPLRFQGQYADEETGLCYNRYRYYDPVVGGFVGQDPIGLEGGEKLYNYAPNSIDWIDPLGLKCKPTKFHKRTVAEVARLRKAFEKAGGARDKFLKSAEKAGEDLTNKIVHHKKPLFRGGTNRKSNLILMDKTNHLLRNADLHWYPEGMNPFGLN